LLEQLSALRSDPIHGKGIGEAAGTIFDIVKFSTHDGPGIRTAVFLKGCPLQCWWCHNPEGQLQRTQLVYRPDRCIRCFSCVNACPNRAIKVVDAIPTTLRDECKLSGECVRVCQTNAREMAGRVANAAEVMAEIEKDTVFYDESNGGVTFSGGEPLMQPIFLLSLLQLCHETGVRTAVETCGFATSEILLSVSPFVNLFLYDVKVMDNDVHRKFTGSSNELILRNLRKLAEVHNAIIVRLPLIPGINDDDANLCRLGEFVSSLRNVRQIDILPYHELGVEKYMRLGMVNRMPKVEVPSASRLDEIVKTLEGFGLMVKVGG